MKFELSVFCTCDPPFRLCPQVIDRLMITSGTGRFRLRTVTGRHSDWTAYPVVGQKDKSTRTRLAHHQPWTPEVSVAPGSGERSAMPSSSLNLIGDVHRRCAPDGICQLAQDSILRHRVSCGKPQRSIRRSQRCVSGFVLHSLELRSAISRVYDQYIRRNR